MSHNNRGLTEGKFANYVTSKKTLFSNAVSKHPELNDLAQLFLI